MRLSVSPVDVRSRRGRERRRPEDTKRSADRVADLSVTRSRVFVGGFLFFFFWFSLSVLSRAVGRTSADHARYPFVVVGHVPVAPSPDVAVVVDVPARAARPPGPLGHQPGIGGLHVVRLPEERARVDERRAEVQPVVAQLGRLVVPRERVMVVVPSLAERQQRHRRVLRGRDVPSTFASSFVPSTHGAGGVKRHVP